MFLLISYTAYRRVVHASLGSYTTHMTARSTCSHSPQLLFAVRLNILTTMLRTARTRVGTAIMHEPVHLPLLRPLGHIVSRQLRVEQQRSIATATTSDKVRRRPPWVQTKYDVGGGELRWPRLLIRRHLRRVHRRRCRHRGRHRSWRGTAAAARLARRPPARGGAGEQKPRHS